MPANRPGSDKSAESASALQSSASWLSVAALRETASRARAVHRSLPDGSVRVLAGGIFLAWAATALFVGVLAWLGPGVADPLLEWDRAIMLTVREHSPVTFKHGIILESPGNILITVPVMALSVSWALWRGRLLFAIALPLGYALARLLIWEGWWIWERARPMLIADGVASSSAHSFPSGHILLATYVYGFLTWLWVEASSSRSERLFAWLVPAAVAGGVGYSRLVLGAHWPSDVIAGFVFGVVYLSLVIVALRVAERRSAGTTRTA